MTTMTRRSALAGLAASSAAAAAGFRASLRHAEAAEPQPLRIPDLIDARAQGNAITLSAQAGQTAFVPGRESATRGFNGGHLGPTLRLHRGDEVEIAVANTMRDSHCRALARTPDPGGGGRRPAPDGRARRHLAAAHESRPAGCDAVVSRPCPRGDGTPSLRRACRHDPRWRRGGARARPAV